MNESTEDVVFANGHFVPIAEGCDHENPRNGFAVSLRNTTAILRLPACLEQCRRLGPSKCSAVAHHKRHLKCKLLRGCQDVVPSSACPMSSEWCQYATARQPLKGEIAVLLARADLLQSSKLPSCDMRRELLKWDLHLTHSGLAHSGLAHSELAQSRFAKPPPSPPVSVRQRWQQSRQNGEVWLLALVPEADSCHSLRRLVHFASHYMGMGIALRRSLFMLQALPSQAAGSKTLAQLREFLVARSGGVRVWEGNVDDPGLARLHLQLIEAVERRAWVVYARLDELHDFGLDGAPLASYLSRLSAKRVGLVGGTVVDRLAQAHPHPPHTSSRLFAAAHPVLPKPSLETQFPLKCRVAPRLRHGSSFSRCLVSFICATRADLAHVLGSPVR